MTSVFTDASAAILQNIDGSQKHKLNLGSPVSVGRSRLATIQLVGDSLSRIHAIIFWDGKFWTVIDSSSNGTFVNGSLIRKHQLHAGDVVGFTNESQWIFIEESPGVDIPTGSTVIFAPDLTSNKDSIHVERAVGQSEWAIVGRSQSMSALRGQITKIAKHRASVCLQGEPGTGKRHIARAIHMAGPEKGRPLLSVNCQTLTYNEIQSLKPQRLIGSINLPGTIVLESIARLSVDLQESLRKILQEHAEAARLGTFGEVSPRWISLTEQPLSDQQTSLDLLIKLTVTQILLDPLSDRQQDISPLAFHFTDVCARHWNKEISTLQSPLVDYLEKYLWPGNAYELRNVIERAVIFNRCGELTMRDIHAGIGIDSAAIPDYQEQTLEEIEAQHILSTLTACHWKKSRVAEILSIERSTLDRKIKKYELKKNSLNQKRL